MAATKISGTATQTYTFAIYSNGSPSRVLEIYSTCVSDAEVAAFRALGVGEYLWPSWPLGYHYEPKSAK